MKKSGNTPVRDPPDLRYWVNTLPARNSAARGIDAISERLFQRCAELLPEELRKHPVAEQLSAAMPRQRG